MKSIYMKFVLIALPFSHSLTTLLASPTLQWATYMGGSGREYGTCVATDNFGNVYMCGNTNSAANIATTGAHQQTFGGGVGSASIAGDAYLSKYSQSGQLKWTTYYGGSDNDAATALAIDSSGNIYITGWTKSTNGIASTGAQQATFGGGEDAFLAKFDTSGTRIWGTYLGGSGIENALLTGGIYVEKNGNIYITGKTNSTSGIASTGTHQPSFLGGSNDAFLVKFSTNGQRIWGTYFGGSIVNTATVGTALTGFENAIYLTGYTTSTSGIASTGAYLGTYAGGTNDAFVARFDTSGAFQWGTYFGGALDDRGSALTCDGSHVYLNGTTFSTSGIATSGSHQNTIAGNQDIFLAQFTTNGQLNWSTYYGGSVLDASAGFMALDATGNIYISGGTSSINNIATTGSIQPLSGGGRDAFIAKFNSGGTRIWGTYYGGTATDYGYGICRNNSGSIFLSGWTLSAAGIATSGSQQTSLGGDNDAFIVRIDDCSIVPKPDTILGPLNVCSRTSATYRITPVANALSYTWITPSGWTGTSSTDSVNLITGIINGTVKVVANGICSSSDTQLLAVNVAPVPVLSPNNPSICDGDSVLLSVAPSPASLSWYRDNVLITGATSLSYYAKQAGNYQVVAVNGACIDTSNNTILVVNPIPVVPGIIRTGQVLSLSQPFVSYQWNFNGVPIVGATSATYSYSIDGNYSVTVTVANGCKATSVVLNTNGAGVGQHQSDMVKIYPNPVSGKNMNVELTFNGEAVLSSIEGRLIGRFSVSKGLNRIPVSGLPMGVYLLRIIDNNGRSAINEKIIVQP